MFYTDTNGQTPSKKCFALVLLEAALEQRLPYEVNIEGFNDLRANLESILGADQKWKFEE